MLGAYLFATALIGAFFLIRYVGDRRRGQPALIASGLGMLAIGLLAPRSGPAWSIMAAVLIGSFLLYTGGLALRRSGYRS